MAIAVTVSKGKVSATYKDAEGVTITEPLSYTKWNIADSNDSITAYVDAKGQDVTVAKRVVATRIRLTAMGIAALSQNSYDGVKINYEAKIIDDGT